MLTLDVCESLRLLAVMSGRNSGLKIAIGHMQHRTRGQNYGPFDHVLQFAYITWPSVFNQRVHRSRWDRLDRLVHLFRRYFHKMLDEEGNIFGPLA